MAYKKLYHRLQRDLLIRDAVIAALIAGFIQATPLYGAEYADGNLFYSVVAFVCLWIVIFIIVGFLISPASQQPKE